MYGNIGLTSAKGSGTSGYVQKSLAFVGNKYQTTSNYKEVLQKFKESPAPQKKKANEEIIEHEMKHKIEVELYVLGERLKEDKEKDMKQIEEEIALKRVELYAKLRNNEDVIANDKETHVQSKLKDNQMAKMKSALNVRNEYEFGTAFDVELQEEKRQQRLLERKEEKRKKMKKIIRQNQKERLTELGKGQSQSRSRSRSKTKHRHHREHHQASTNQIEKQLNRKRNDSSSFSSFSHSPKKSSKSKEHKQ